MARILSISYDPTLLKTRHFLLEHEGHAVVSAEGFAESFERINQGPFDLMVMGHSIPHSDKVVFRDSFRKLSTAPILALLRSDEIPLEGAAESIDPTNVPAFLDAIKRLVGAESMV